MWKIMNKSDLLFGILVIAGFAAVGYLMKDYTGVYPSPTPLPSACNSDADCAIRSTGCNCCGYTYTCASKDAKDGICSLTSDQMNCKCAIRIPQSCNCVNKVCEDVW